MKIAMCGSMTVHPKIMELASQLEAMGHTTIVPKFSLFELERIGQGESLESIHGESTQAKIDEDLIRYFYRQIQESDAILVVNIERKGIPGYIGGNTFLEIGFAHVLGKQVFLLHPLPEMAYTDELLAMQPTVLDGNVEKLALTRV